MMGLSVILYSFNQTEYYDADYRNIYNLVRPVKSWNNCDLELHIYKHKIAIL